MEYLHKLFSFNCYALLLHDKEIYVFFSFGSGWALTERS